MKKLSWWGKYLLVVSIFIIILTIGCQGVFSPPTTYNINLTDEEKNILLAHSFNPPYIVRWPDKAVITVYDETNFDQLDYVLDEWNKCFNGKITLIKTNNPGAKVKIIFEDLEGNVSGRAITWYNSENLIIKGLIKIDKTNYGYDIDTYLHEFGHILGCHEHLNQGLMGGGNNKVDTYTCWYFNLLYSLPIGYKIQ